MQQQMGRIGVNGRENIFIFQAIKNAIGNSVDRLFAMVAGSKQLRTALSTVRDLIEGFTKHLEDGGSIRDLLFGKKGGKSGGLLGLAGSLFVDIGENIGRGILGGILKGLAALPGLFSQAFDFLKKKALEAIKFLEPHVKEFFKPLTDALALLKETLTPVAEEASKKLSEGFNSAVNAVKKLLNIPDFITPRPTGRFATPTSQSSVSLPPRGMFEGEGPISIGQLLDNVILRVIPRLAAEFFGTRAFERAKNGGFEREQLNGPGGTPMARGPGRVPGTMKGFFAHFFGSSALASVSSQSPSLKQNSPQSILAVLSQVFGKVKEFVKSIPPSARDAVSEGKKLIESLDALGDKVLEQVPKFDRLREQIDALFSDFPADAKKKPAVDPKTIPLTAAERRRKRARVRRIDREIALRERGGAGVRQRALSIDPSNASS